MPRVRNEGTVLLCVAVTLAVAAWQITSFASRDSRPLLPRHRVTASGAIEVPVDLLAMPSVVDDQIETVALSRQARWLHGRKVVMHGIMFPTFDDAGITRYFFSPETRGKGYHFGSSIPLHLAIQVSTLEGHTEDFQSRPFTVEAFSRSTFYPKMANASGPIVYATPGLFKRMSGFDIGTRRDSAVDVERDLKTH